MGSVKKTQKLTAIVIFIVIIAILGYDVFAFNSAGTEGTVSFVIYDWSHKYPVFTFAMGFIMGHLFWQMRKKAEVVKLMDRVKELEGEK